MSSLVWPQWHYDPSSDPSRPYRLAKDHTLQTTILGQFVHTRYYILFRDGRLLIREGYRWDGGTNAIDDMAMIIASLGHDPICEMTNAGVIAYKWRAHGDALLIKLLRMYTVNLDPEAGYLERLAIWLRRQWRWVRYAGVRLNSEIKRWSI